MLSSLEFNLEDQKQATYKMFGPDTDYSLIDKGKQYYVCFQTAYLVASSASIFVRNI